MKHKILMFGTMITLAFGALTGCSNDSEVTVESVYETGEEGKTENEETQAQEETEYSEEKNEETNEDNYKAYFEAYAEYYNTFYLENFQQEYVTGDCAGKIILDEENKPLLVVNDVKMTNDVENQTFVADLHFFTYEDGEIKERMKLANLIADGNGIGVVNYDDTIYALVNYGMKYYFKNENEEKLQFYKLTSDGYEKIKANIVKENWQERYGFSNENDNTAYNLWYLSADPKQSINLYCDDRNVSCLSGKDFKEYLNYLKECKISSNIDMELICTEYMMNMNMYDIPKVYYGHEGVIYRCHSDELLKVAGEVLINDKSFFCGDGNKIRMKKPILCVERFENPMTIRETDMYEGKTIPKRINGVKVYDISSDEPEEFSLFADATKITEISEADGIYKVVVEEGLNNVRNFELNLTPPEYSQTTYSLGCFTETDGRYQAEYFQKPVLQDEPVLSQIDFDEVLELIESAKTKPKEKVIVKFTIHKNALMNITVAADDKEQAERIEACLAYEDYLYDHDIISQHMSLIYIDDDHIPEILAYKMGDNTGYLLTYENGAVKELLFKYTIHYFMYEEKSGYYYFAGIQASEHYYHIGKNEDAYILNSFDPVCYIGENEVSKTEYDAHVANLNLKLVEPVFYERIEEAYHGLMVDDYKKAYSSYIKENLSENLHLTYYFMDINQDGMEELVYEGSMADGIGILTYYNGEVSFILLEPGGLSYLKDENTLFHSYGRMGENGHRVFRLLNGTDVTVIEGTYSEVISKVDGSVSFAYAINGNNVTEEEYEKCFCDNIPENRICVLDTDKGIKHAEIHDYLRQ